jgi:hypothetical protein
MCNYYNERYSPSSEWYEPITEPTYQCSDCEPVEQKLNDAKEYLEAVVDMLYSKQPLDRGLLESNLDELCALIGIKIGVGELQVQRTNKQPTVQPIFSIEDWKSYNNKYLKQLTQ